MFVRLFDVVDNRLLFENSFYLANLANRIVWRYFNNESITSLINLYISLSTALNENLFYCLYTLIFYVCLVTCLIEDCCCCYVLLLLLLLLLFILVDGRCDTDLSLILLFDIVILFLMLLCDDFYRLLWCLFVFFMFIGVIYVLWVNKWL